MVTALLLVHFSSRVAGKLVSKVVDWSRLLKLLWNRAEVRVDGMFVNRSRCAGGVVNEADDKGILPPEFSVE